MNRFAVAFLVLVFRLPFAIMTRFPARRFHSVRRT